MSDTTENEITITVEPEAPVMAAPPATPAPRKLTPGRVVHYLARHGEFQGLEGGVKYPAMVVRVWSDICANIAVYTDSAQFPLHTITSAVAGDEPGQWSWPELV